MGLLSSAFAKGFVKGVGENIVDWQDEVKEKEDLYNENLIKAKRKVNETTAELGKKYDDTVSLVNRYGGGAFGNYLVQTYSFDDLSEFNSYNPVAQRTAMESIKNYFDKEVKDKSQYINAEFTKTAKQKLDEQVQATKESEIAEIAGEAPVAPTGKIGQVLTGGIRAGAEAEREKIMGGFAEPVTTAEYAPVDRDFKTSTGLTLKQKSANLTYFYETLQSPEEDTAGRLTGEYVPNKGQEDFVKDIEEKSKTLIENGFAGSENDAIAEVIFKLNNPDYDLPLLTQAAPNSPRASELLDLFLSAKSTNNQLAMEGAIDEANQFNLLDLSSDFQLQYDNYIKSLTDKKADVSDTTVTTDIPEGGLIEKGRMKTIGATGYTTPEERLKNSQIDVTEDFIQQVMQKNNTSRQGAINILKDYGYKKFPKKQSNISTVKGRMQGE